MTQSHIFISWSLPGSRVTAERLHAFFRRLFPTFQFFISSEDIKTGQRWYDEISERLGECDVGIIVVTQENYLRPWIHYEAGALAKTVEKTRVMPILCGISPALIADTPLSAFQAAELNRAGMLRVAQSIRDHAGYAQVEAEFLEQFESLWERLGEEMCELPAAAQDIASVPKESQTQLSADKEISAQLSMLTDIVKSMEARLPSPSSYDRELNKSVQNYLLSKGYSISEINAMSLEEVSEAIASDKISHHRNALSSLVVFPPVTKRRGLLGTIGSDDEEK